MILGLEFPPISHVVEWPVGPARHQQGRRPDVVLDAHRDRRDVARRPQEGARAHRHPERRRVGRRLRRGGHRPPDDRPRRAQVSRPFLITLFTFILSCNIWGLVPARADAGERPHRPARVHGAAGVRDLPHRRRRLSGPDHVPEEHHVHAGRAEGRCTSCSRPSSWSPSSSASRSAWRCDSSPTCSPATCCS